MISKKADILRKGKRIFLRIAIALFILLNIITAFHAYKFTHFYNADGVDKIAAKKSGWQKFTDIFTGIKAYKKIVVKEDTSFTDIELNTDDGFKLQGWYKASDSSKGTVILFHGHGSNRTGVLNEAAEFYNLRYNVFLIDFRAHGNSEGNTCTIGFNEAVDVKAAYEFIATKGEKNIVLWGISLGAATISRAIYKFEIKPQKIILELPFASVLQAVKGRVTMMGLPVQPISTLLTFWGGVETGFWAYNLKPAEYVKSISCPVLLQFARNDKRVSLEEANEIYKNISAPKQMIIYENSGHESLCKNEHDKWMLSIKNFLNGH